MTNPMTEAEATDLQRLRLRLVDDAARSDVLDVAYRTLDSPVGSLIVATTATGLVRLGFAVSENQDEVLQELADRVSPRILQAPARLDDAARQLEEYFAGHRTSFELPVDLRLSGGYRLEVLQHLRGIAFGDTESYTEVAAATGRPRAVRAVGSACATNPLPVVVPCHRVLRSDGSLGGYRGGLAAKRVLLDLESAAS